MRRALAVLVVACWSLFASSCEESCLGADEACTITSPCAALQFECAAPNAPRVHRLQAGDPIPGGLNVLASPGDVVLDNGVVTAVIDALDHPHYVAPTGGHLLDLASSMGDDDSLTHVFHTVGFLPGDSVRYERMTLEQGEGYAAVQVHGVLDGDENVRVATRYEIRPCEPGIRVRTEMVNRGVEPRVWSLVDAWYWSGREALPFAPGRGRGFEQPGFQDPVSSSWEPFPFMAAAAHADPAASYVEVACNARTLQGFHTEQLSAAGRPIRVVQPRDVEVFERFLGVVPGRAIGPAADLALELRRQLHGERYTELSGRVQVAGNATVGHVLGDEVRAAIVIAEGTLATPIEERTPWTQVTPAADGTFRARVPAGRDYVLDVRAFGRTAELVEARVNAEPTDVGVIEVSPAAELEVTVLVDGVPDHAQVFVHPADDATREAVEARLFDGYYDCAPLLGSPVGGSPSCDRLLVRDSTTVQLPPGRYDVYATAGIFATLARETIDARAGERASVTLSLSRLSIAPENTLSADFHVHGAASFDSTIPDLDRVQAFLAANVDVLAATDHDVVWSYEDARAALDVDSRMRVMVGLETTGHILFDLTPGSSIPQVIGHWNVWPLPFTPDAPYRGAPWDELAEPGLLFDRFVEAGWPRDTGIIQLNHPWSPAQVGRDLGFPRAVGVDARVPLPVEHDGTGPGLVLRTPPGASFSNADYHTQEVMNGTANEDLQPFRSYWFYLLNQGIVRAGTANSDSHSLVDNILGTPRTLVWTDQTIASFDEARFNRAVREGRMIGTNGPVIEVSTTDAMGNVRTPSVEAFAPGAGALLAIRVSAAPWVPVEEVRIVVNGRVARVLSAELSSPADPFGTEGLVRFEGTVALSELLPDDGRDAWIVVEAGTPLATQGDLDCDGIPDTGDNDGNGVIDWRDVDRNDDDVVDRADLDEVGGAAPPCDGDADVGPLGHPPAPTRGQRGYEFLVVTPGGYPASFTNPLLLDRNGGGFTGPGLPMGGP
jgi:hypothetical protein